MTRPESGPGLLPGRLITLWSACCHIPKITVPRRFITR